MNLDFSSILLRKDEVETMTSLVLAAMCAAPMATDLLPDIILWGDRLNDYYVGTTGANEAPSGRPCIRFSTATANIGAGRLELRGGTPSGSIQPVNQRIFRSDGTSYDRLAGNFVYHPSHQHIHFNDWTVFRLREILPGGGVGNVIRSGQKTSFCILELLTYDNSLPGYNSSPGYSSCGQVQGLRPGRADIYDASLDDQYIDITGLPDGDYWLEGEVDPNNQVLESNETNNVGRIQVHVGVPPPTTADRYEEDDTQAITLARPEAGTNSPNLGTVNALRNIDHLSMDDAADWFRFRLNNTGESDDYVRISSMYGGSDIDLFLYNSNNTLLGSSESGTNTEQVSLSGRAPGYYWIKVLRYSGSNPRYLLTIQPSTNRPPNLTMTSPIAPGMWVEKSWDTVPVSWTGNDPDGDPKTVSLYIDRNQVFGGTNIPVGGYQGIPFGSLSVNLNTAGIGLGRWYIFGRAFDGGDSRDVWAPGWFTLYKKLDVNFDGLVTELDYLLAEYCESLPMGLWPEGWSKILDYDRDNDVDNLDWKEFRIIVGKS